MYLKVTVRAGQREDAVELRGDRYVITTRARAERGLANEKAAVLLALYLGVEAKDLSLVKGADRPSKLFILRGRVCK